MQEKQSLTSENILEGAVITIVGCRAYQRVICACNEGERIC
jgi:hypothetical protein